jgi:hypothetical protein
MLSDRELLASVQEAADDFIVYGELGRQGDALAALLARRRVERKLVVLMVNASTNAEGEIELSIDVKDELDARIPDGGTKCPACSATLRPWVRFCTRCGHDVTGKGAVSPEEREALRNAVMSAVEDDYEYLGEIRRSEGGGDVFFARERTSGRIAALRLNQSQTDGEFELGETNILRKAPAPSQPKASVVSVTQLLRKLDPEPAHVPPPTPPRPVAAPRPAPARPAPPAAPANSAPVAADSPAIAAVTTPNPAEHGDGAPSGLPWSRTAMLRVGVILVAVLVLLTVLVLR